MLGESSSPTPDQPRRGIQPGRDLGVGQSLGRVQHDPRALHLLEGQLLRPRCPFQRRALLLAELDPVPGRTRHHPQIQRPRPDPSTSFRPILPAAPTSEPSLRHYGAEHRCIPRLDRNDRAERAAVVVRGEGGDHDALRDAGRRAASLRQSTTGRSVIRPVN